MASEQRSKLFLKNELHKFRGDCIRPFIHFLCNIAFILMMQFQVTEIEFDFEDAFGEWTQHHFDNVTADTLETIWEADDGEDLVDEITAATGWCIKSIDYRHILN